MKVYLQIELLLRETTMADSKLLVNEFDGKDRLGSMERCCFLDALNDEASAIACTQEMSSPTNQAYAPCPIVFETIRKGSSLGNGASCEWAIMIGKGAFQTYYADLLLLEH